MSAPPRSEAELIDRARALAGRRVDDLAASLGLALPASTRAGKGFVGQLLERALGATAGSLSEPDFQHIGVEMKTIPVAADGRPLESTYVCTVRLDGPAGRFEDSAVAHKLARVLWVPVEGERAIPVADRRVGSAVLWSPSPDQLAILRADFEELMEMVALGRVDEVDARHGVALQLRPKAADSRARRAGVGRDGERTRTLPRGFYLRTSFTADLLARCWLGR